jgi:hypothetical protein
MSLANAIHKVETDKIQLYRDNPASCGAAGFFSALARLGENLSLQFVGPPERKVIRLGDPSLRSSSEWVGADAWGIAEVPRPAMSKSILQTRKPVIPMKDLLRQQISRDKDHCSPQRDRQQHPKGNSFDSAQWIIFRLGWHRVCGHRRS